MLTINLKSLGLILITLTLLSGCACVDCSRPSCDTATCRAAYVPSNYSSFGTTYECVNYPYPNTNRYTTHYPYGDNTYWYGGVCNDP